MAPMTSNSDASENVGGGGDVRKPPAGIQPSAVVDEQRNRIDYNRGIEISEAIIRYCAEELPWPTEWDEEMAYIAECLGHRAVDIELRDM